MKKRTSIMIEEETLKQCKLQGINMSDVCQKALESVLAGSHFVDEEAYLEHLLKRKRDAERRILSLKEQLKIVESANSKLTASIEKQMSVVKLLRKSRLVANLIGEINETIKSCSFDFKESWQRSKELREKLTSLEHSVDEKWFKDQIIRVKQWM